MTIGFVFICLIICTICKCLMFKRRNIRWWYAIIPGLDKYTIGKLVQNKKLAIANCISYLVYMIVYITNFFYNIWIIANYSVDAKIPEDIQEQSVVNVALPKNIATSIYVINYAIIIIGLITLILWCMMMWKFTVMHKKNTWWILLWALMPVIPYIYFTASSDFVSKDGKLYTLKKVEITE